MRTFLTRRPSLSAAAYLHDAWIQIGAKRPSVVGACQAAALSYPLEAARFGALILEAPLRNMAMHRGTAIAHESVSHVPTQVDHRLCRRCQLEQARRSPVPENANGTALIRRPLRWARRPQHVPADESKDRVWLGRARPDTGKWPGSRDRATSEAHRTASTP